MFQSKVIRALVALVSTVCFAVAAEAQTTWYVDIGNCPAAGTGSQEDPFCTIQPGMNAAANGDVVIVADGTYTGPGNKDLSFNAKAFTLRSQNGAESCIIDCQGSGRAFWFFGAEGPGSVVEGFTVTGANGNPGGAFYVYYNADPTINNCIIKGNTSNSGGPGGAFYCTIAAPTITNCTITGNAAGSGGAVYAEFGSNPTITNCIIADNSADTAAGGIYIAADSTATLSNSILWNNELEEIYEVDSGAIAVSYSDVQGGWPGAGNIDADPLFVDPSNGNYHYEPGSPAIDAGDNLMVPAGIITDLDGNPRFLDDPDTPDTGNPDGVNALVEMGAYEFQDTPPLPCPADLDGDGSVGPADLAMLLAAWGPIPTPEPPDFDGDGDVDPFDLAFLLGSWGSCP